MKSYERQVVWLGYFDSELKASEGRRLPLNSCVRSPTLDELTKACLRAELDPQPQAARYPRSATKPSGYVSIKKGGPKRGVLLRIARELSAVRGEGSQATRKV